MKTVFTIKGTHCQSCKALIEEIALEVPGIKACTVDFETGRTEVEHEGVVDWGKFKREVEGVGTYTVN